MKTLPDDDFLAYIDNRTARLREDRKWLSVRTAIAWAVALGLWGYEAISGGEALIVMVVASGWASVSSALANQHIDTLISLRHQVDADRA